MKVSREQVAENRQTILDAAGRLFKAKGYEAVTVADVMKAASLTHGGFYGYFDSKDDLIAQTLAHAVGGKHSKPSDIADYAVRYLSSRHRDDLAGGCPMAGLAAETARQSPEARSALSGGVRRQIEWLAEGAAGDNDAERRRVAVGSWAAMVGAVILARLSDDPQFSHELLNETQAFIADKQGADKHGAKEKTSEEAGAKAPH